MANDKAQTAKERALAELKKAYDEGEANGIRLGQRQILDFLQHAYIEDQGRPDRGTPKAEAILEMAKQAAAHFKLKLQVQD